MPNAWGDEAFSRTDQNEWGDQLDGPVISATEEPTIATKIREALSPLIGETENQKAIRSARESQLETISPELTERVRETPDAKLQARLNESGALGVAHEIGSKPLIGFGDSEGSALTIPKISASDPLNVAANVGAGAANAIGRVAAGLTSPENIALGGVLSAGGALAEAGVPAAKTIMRGAGLGLGAQMAQAAGEEAGKASVDITDPNLTLAEKVESALSPVLTGALAVGAASGALPSGERRTGAAPVEAAKATEAVVAPTDTPVQVEAPRPSSGLYERLKAEDYTPGDNTKILRKDWEEIEQISNRTKETGEPEYLYTVFQDAGNGKPRAIQVDEVKGGENTSSSREELIGKGADLPLPPDWLPAGQFTRAEIRDAINFGEPPAVQPGVVEQLSPEAQLADAVQTLPAATTERTSPEPASQPMGIVLPGSGKVLDALSDVSSAGKKAIKEVQGIPQFTPFKKAINEFVGSRQLNSLAVRDVVESLRERIPSEIDREAITNYIQAGGDRALLEARRDASKDARRKDAYDAASKLSDEQTAIADGISEFYAKKLEEAQDWGIIEEGIPNYVNQVWRQPVFGEAPAASEFGGRLSQNFRSARQRSFESFFEGEQAGFRPETKDISSLMALYSDGLNKAIATRKLVKDLTSKKASDGRPLAAPAGSVNKIEGASEGDPLFIRPRTRGEETSDYRLIDNPALYKWKWTTEENGTPVMVQGQLAVHPEVYYHLKDMLGRSAIREWYDKPSDALKGIFKNVVRAVDRGGQAFKGMSLSFLSPFHQVQEATHAVGHKINPFTNLPDLKADNPVVDRAVRHGLMLAGEREAMQYFSEGLGDAAKSNPLFKLPIVGKWAQDYSTWLFHDYIPKLKLKTYEAVEQRNMKRYADEIKAGKIKADQIQYLSALQVNAAYGHLNYADIGRNPTMQHLLQMTLLAPDFLEARGRFTGQAMKGLTSKAGREQLNAMATLAATFYVTARVLNKTLDDDYHWDHPFEVVNGDRTYSMRSVPEDIFNLMKDSRRFIYGRLSPIIGRGSVELLTGKNYRGEKNTLTSELQDLATRWIPINLQGFFKELSPTGQASPTSPWEQFLSSSGLNIKRRSKINDVYSLAADWKKSAGIAEDTGTYPISKYQQLRYALEDGNQTRAIEEIRKLTKDSDPQKIYDGFKQSLMHPFTGSQVNDVRFIHSLGDDDRAKVKAAVETRGRILDDFIKALARSGAQGKN